MLGLGLLVGFLGLGGAGFIVGVLVVVFQVPIHLAFGTALGAVFAASITGGWSHVREGNVDLTTALQVGITGAIGAYLGGTLALATDARQLKTLGGLVLMAATVVFYLRTRLAAEVEPAPLGPRTWSEGLPRSMAVGAPCGFVSGYLSIGMAPWIQVGLLLAHRMELRRSIGTAMVALSCVTASGAARFAQGGQLDLGLLVSVVLGLSCGTYLGAKLTRRAPLPLIRVGLVAAPILAGGLLLLAPSP